MRIPGRLLSGVVVAVLASGVLASCGLVEARPRTPSPAPAAPTIPLRTTEPTVQPTVQPTATATTTSSGPSDNTVLTKNKLYAVALKSTGCRKPQVTPTSATAVNEFYDGLLKCLNRGWPAAITAAGYKFHQPSMAVVFAVFNTPCGKSAPYVSFYCSSDETIYLRGDEILISNRDYGPIGASWWASHVGTHEYGHYVQQLTGMMTAYQNLYAAAPDQAAKDQLERRLELQASCLGHVFLTANRRTYPITAQMRGDWGWQIISIPNHGSPANQRYWINRAVQLKRPGACNTWAAPAAQVA